MVLCLAAAGALCAAAPASAAGALSATPASAPAGAPITFSGALPAGGPFRLDFGDGTGVTFTGPSFSIVHVYQRAGRYTALLTNAVAVLGTAVVTIVQPAFRPGRAPIGQIYTTTLTIPSVLAGGETALVVRYSIGDATYAGSGAPVLAYVELRSPKGALIRRSDPFEIVPGGTAGMQSAVIPYSVPVDAGGTYALRVVLRAAGGGAIASSDLLPLLVAAGPDPKPEVHSEFRASGAVEVGPNATSSASFNPGALVALQWPAHQLSLSGLYDPVSHRPDPLLTLESRAPGAVQSPDAAATASPPPSPPPGSVGSFKDTLGRSSATLPALLGDGTTLRGLDASRSVGPWVLHGAYGYAQLSTPSVPAERAGIIDVGRTLGAGSVRAALYQRDDDVPIGYVVTPNVPGPLRAIVAELDLKQPVVRNVTLTASAANSDATSLVQPLNVTDAAARAELAYASGTTNARLEY
ncbi:MAG TPA: PKD domain-containing protein, partial [Xanthomonadales bacterium]|nr:PKD domain-containing protein [Xanthomonadales bacterium]